MRNHLIPLLTLLLLTPPALHAQTTIADHFAAAPANIFPLLPPSTRLDMIDYAKAALPTPSTNTLDGKTSITTLTPDNLTIRLTDNSTAQLTLLPGPTPTLLLITTHATPALDSSIRLYTTDWQPLPTPKYITLPTLKDWATPRADLPSITLQIPFMLASYTYDPLTQNLTLTNNLDKFLDPDIYATLRPQLHPTLTYHWNGRRFAK